MLLNTVCAVLLLSGLALMDGVYKANSRMEEDLRTEKRHLTMLVDRRVADLEAEVAERTRAEEELRRDGERFSAIIATQRDIATAELDLDAVMDLIVTRAQALTGASGGATLKMVEGTDLVYRAASGPAAQYIGLRTPWDAGLAGECLRSGQALRCDDAERDPRVNRDLCRRTASRSLVLVPLRYDRRVVGVLSVMSPERHAFGVGDEQTLQLMAGLMGAAMSHAAEFQAKQALLTEAVERAERDPLTGLLNHRAFHRRLEEEADRAQHEGTSLAVAVMDLDNFKFFNDAYGHIIGDEVLRRVAAVLQDCCGPAGHPRALRRRRIRPADARHVAGGGPPSAGPAARAPGRRRLPAAGLRRADPDVPLRRRGRFPRGRGDAHGRGGAGGRPPAAGQVGEGAHAEPLRTALARSVEGFSMLDALVTAVDNKDRYTHRHCEDVLTYSLEIAREMGMDEATQQTVATAALLHDVGKIGVPDPVLRKPGRLTEEEFEAVKQHPQMGAVIVGAVPGLRGHAGRDPPPPRALGRPGLPVRPGGRGDPAPGPPDGRRRRLLGHDHRPPLPQGNERAKALAVLEQGPGPSGTRSASPPSCASAVLPALRKIHTSPAAGRMNARAPFVSGKSAIIERT